MKKNDEEVFIDKNKDTEGFEFLCESSYFHKVAFKVTTEGVECLAVPVGNEDPYVQLLVQDDDGEWVNRRVVDSSIDKVEKIDFIELPKSITKHAGKHLVLIDFNPDEIERISKAMILEGLNPKDEDAFEAFVVDFLVKKKY